MKVEVKELDGVRIIKLEGQIRVSTQNGFKDAMDDMIRENLGKTAILNLDGIDYMNSIGLGIVVDTYKKFVESGGRFIICNLRPDILNLFEVTNLNKLIEICGNESQALSKIFELESMPDRIMEY